MKIMSAEAMDALVAASVISITLNPLFCKAIDRILDWLETQKILRPPEFIPATSAFEKDPSKNLVIVVGYGPFGRTVSRILQDNNVQPIAD